MEVTGAVADPDVEGGQRIREQLWTIRNGIEMVPGTVLLVDGTSFVLP